MPVTHSTLIGATQIFALAPGISRSGVAMVGGMVRGLSREDAARFSFLLATPVILAAGALKLGDLTGPLGDGIRPQVLFGSLLSGVGAYLSVRYLTRYFANRSLRPFGVYCLARRSRLPDPVRGSLIGDARASPPLWLEARRLDRVQHLQELGGVRPAQAVHRLLTLVRRQACQEMVRQVVIRHPASGSC